MSAFAKRLWIVGFLVVVPAVVMACSVPVFRYALDHWHPDAYQIFVYHDEDLDEQDESLLGRIRQEADAGANAKVRTIDLRDELEPRDQLRWEYLSKQSEGHQALPRMVVHRPAGIGDGEAPVQSSAWDADEVERLLGSPARVELSERLIRGEVVWVYLESANADADDDARFELLESELARQQETLELPEIDPDDLDEMTSDADELQIQFTALRLARDDPAEKWFVEMLLSVEPDLRDETLVDQAMVFPVFGRGRALYALVGDGINGDMIKEAAVFLTGACQCTVKAENPGVDLLIPVLWDQFIETSEPEAFHLPLIGLTSSFSDEDAATGTSGGGETNDSNTPEVSMDASANPASDDAIAASAETSGESTSADHQASDALVSGEGALGNSEQAGWVRWLPWGVIAVIGAVVMLSGATILRRQENH